MSFEARRNLSVAPVFIDPGRSLCPMLLPEADIFHDLNYTDSTGERHQRTLIGTEEVLPILPGSTIRETGLDYIPSQDRSIDAFSGYIEFTPVQRGMRSLRIGMIAKSLRNALSNNFQGEIGYEAAITAEAASIALTDTVTKDVLVEIGLIFSDDVVQLVFYLYSDPSQIDPLRYHDAEAGAEMWAFIVDFAHNFDYHTYRIGSVDQQDTPPSVVIGNSREITMERFTQALMQELTFFKDNLGTDSVELAPGIPYATLNTITAQYSDKELSDRLRRAVDYARINKTPLDQAILEFYLS